MREQITDLDKAIEDVLHAGEQSAYEASSALYEEWREAVERLRVVRARGATRHWPAIEPHELGG